MNTWTINHNHQSQAENPLHDVVQQSFPFHGHKWAQRMEAILSRIFSLEANNPFTFVQHVP